MDTESPSFWTLLGRGTRRRCPACGRGRLFAGLLRLTRACPACGFLVNREPGAVTGAMYLVAIVTQLFAAALVLALWLLTDWTAWTMIAAGAPAIAVFAFWALAWSRAVWVAVDYYTDLKTGETARPDYARRAFDAKRPDAPST